MNTGIIPNNEKGETAMTLYDRPFNRFATPLLAFALTCSCLAGSAGAQESHWHLRARGLLVSADQAFAVEGPAGSTELAGGNTSLGGGLALEYRFSDRFGVELGSAYADVPDYDRDESSSGGKTEVGDGPSFAPMTLSLNLHLTPDRRFDVYVAPTVAYVTYGDFDLDLGEGPTTFETEDDFAWGGTVGCDYRFGDSRWALNAAATYLSSDMEVTRQGTDDTTAVSFDPLMVQIGATVTF